MTRAEHLQWCKDRALKYLDIGDTMNAFSSMMSDLRKHPDTENHFGIEMGMMLMMHGNMKSISDVKKFIVGFN